MSLMAIDGEQQRLSMPLMTLRSSFGLWQIQLYKGILLHRSLLPENAFRGKERKVIKPLMSAGTLPESMFFSK